jgi:hypothetical protein
MLPHPLALPFNRPTLRETAYALLGLPLGITWFTLFTTALAFGAGLAFTIIGLPILAVTLRLSARVLGLEARLAEKLLGRPPSGVAVAAPAEPLLRTLRRRDAWRRVAHLLALLPAGIATFTAALVAWAIGLSWTTAPLWAPFIATAARPPLVASDHGTVADAGAWTVTVVLGLLSLLLTRAVLDATTRMRVRLMA